MLKLTRVVIALIIVPIFMVSCNNYGITVQNDRTLPQEDTNASTKVTGGAEKDVKEVKVVLLAGQSNALGHTTSSYLIPQIAQEKAALYTNGFENGLIYYSLPERKSVCKDFVPVKLGQGSESARFGPEIGIADYWAEKYPDETVYIIKYAVGSTDIYKDWLPDSGNCYVGFVQCVSNALDVLKNKNYAPEIVAICWAQGETEATGKAATRPSSYASYLEDFASAVRNKFADYAAYDKIYFIDAGIINIRWTYFAEVNESKRKFADMSDYNIYLDTISAKLDTTKENNDTAHYDSYSMLTLGRMFGEAICNIIK